MLVFVCFCLFFKQKTAYEMRISDWSSDVCSSDLHFEESCVEAAEQRRRPFGEAGILDHQPLILDEAQPRFCRGLGGAVADHRRAFLMVDDAVASAQLFGIVSRRADGDLTGPMEALAARRATGWHPLHVTPDHIIPEDRDHARKEE